MLRKRTSTIRRSGLERVDGSKSNDEPLLDDEAIQHRGAAAAQAWFSSGRAPALTITAAERHDRNGAATSVEVRFEVGLASG
jgi:hypothetical protein